MTLCGMCFAVNFPDFQNPRVSTSVSFQCDYLSTVETLEFLNETCDVMSLFFIIFRIIPKSQGG